MAGIFFDYEPGRIDARFSHDDQFDYINLDIRVDGDITTTTECDDEGRLAKPEHHKKEGAEFRVYMSSVFCPFGGFISFLEAITTQVKYCGFDWDPEGPSGEMRWDRRFVNEDGFLTVEWNSSKEQFSHRMMLNTRQAVRVLYNAFRSFVESSEYDPLRYEKLTNGNGFLLVLSDASLDDLAGVIALLNADAARTVFERLWDAGYERQMKGPKLSFPIEHFLGSLENVAPSNESDSWIQPEWDSWDRDKRMSHLGKLFDWGSMGWYGADLRELRSKLVEGWLALPEPPPRRAYKIPIAATPSETEATRN